MPVGAAPDDDAVPCRAANTLSLRSVFFAWHFGHATVASLERTSSSKPWPHDAQTYSKIGMPNP